MRFTDAIHPVFSARVRRTRWMR